MGALPHKAFDPCDLLGEADGFKVVVGLGEGAGVLAEAVSSRGVFEEGADFSGEGGGVEEVHELAGVVVGNRFVQGRGVAGDDGATGAHGFEQAPAQYKRVG